MIKKDFKRMQEDSDEEPTAITEEQFELIVDKMVNLEFETEDAAFEFFDAQYQDALTSLRKVNVANTKKEIKKRANLYRKEEEIEPTEFLNRDDKTKGGDTMFLDEYLMDKKNAYDEWEMQQNEIGKYPLGFRKYENFINYRVVHPEADIENYMREMNRECTYLEFLAIMRASILQDSKKYKFSLDDYDHEGLPGSGDDEITDDSDDDTGATEKKESKSMDEFLRSEVFEKAAKQRFMEVQYANLTERKLFTLVDCLEETMDLWSYGRNIFEVPTHNVYIPVKTTLMSKPKFIETEDELGVRLINRNDKSTTTPRINPLAPLSPLKGIKLSPRSRVKTYEQHERPNDKIWNTLRTPSKLPNAPKVATKFKFSTLTVPQPIYLSPLQKFFGLQRLSLNKSPFRQ